MTAFVTRLPGNICWCDGEFVYYKWLHDLRLLQVYGCSQQDSHCKMVQNRLLRILGIHRSCAACLPGWLRNNQPISRPKTLNHLSKKAYATLARFCQWPFLACKKKMKLDLLCIWLQFTGQNIASYVWTNNIIKPFQNFRGGINKIQSDNNNTIYLMLPDPRAAAFYWKAETFGCLQLDYIHIH